MYVYWVVCYRVIVAPYVRSVGHVFAYLYTLGDDSECPMDYETSLLSNVFSFIDHNLRSVNFLIKYTELCHPHGLLWLSQHNKCRIK